MHIKASAAGAAYGTALVSNNARLWFAKFDPNTPQLTNLVGSGGTIEYNESTLTYTITTPAPGQITVWVGGGVGNSGEITFSS